MQKAIDYYLSLNSPWAFLGHARLVDIARRHRATIAVRPVDYGRIFPVTGGLPLPQRAKARRDYRMIELRRWRDHLGIAFNLEPKYSRVTAEPAGRLVIAAVASGLDGLPLCGDIMRAVWTEERDISDAAVLKEIAAARGHDGDALLAKAGSAESEAIFRANTEEALDAGVFGAPTYVYKGELFWGQDRLDFLDRALAQ